MSGYRAYAADTNWQEQYAAYQERYRHTPRESDWETTRIVAELCAEHNITEAGRAHARLSLLDAGCSTGNLLRLLHLQLPGLRLDGCDLAEVILSQDRDDSYHLFGGDITSLGVDAQYDIVTVSAVLYLLDTAEFEQALASIFAALRPGGHLVAWDWFNPYEQQLDIVETSASHPQGLGIRCRPYSLVEQACYHAGYVNTEFRPFEIGFDLPPPSSRDDLGSYTVDTTQHGRMIFRGLLHQPWCHLIAHKAMA